MDAPPHRTIRIEGIGAGRFSAKRDIAALHRAVAGLNADLDRYGERD